MLAAAATERIQIGTGVTNPVSRDPAVMASAALGLQIESGGRFVLGIGRGDSSMAKLGRRPAPPAELDLYLERLRAYLDGEVVDREGEPSRIEWLDDVDVPRCRSKSRRPVRKSSRMLHARRQHLLCDRCRSGAPRGLHGAR